MICALVGLGCLYSLPIPFSKGNSGQAGLLGLSAPPGYSGFMCGQAMAHDSGVSRSLRFNSPAPVEKESVGVGERRDKAPFRRAFREWVNPITRYRNHVAGERPDVITPD